MKGSFSVLLSTAVALLFLGSPIPPIEAGATEDYVELIIEIPDPLISDQGPYTEVLIDGWGSSFTPGEAVLPEKTFYIPVNPDDIPRINGHSLSGTNIVRTGTVPEVPLPSAGGITASTQGDGGKDIVTSMGTILTREGTYLMIRVAPFSVEDGDLLYPDVLTIGLEMDTGSPISRVKVDPFLEDPTVRENVRDVPLWENTETMGPVPSGTVYHNTIPDTECLIITSSSLNNSLKPLAEWKTRRGVYTRVVETSWIYSNFNGADNQEKIRNCTKAFYSNEDLEWVILGGDHSVVPTRMAYIPDGYGDTGSDGSTVPADGYYGDLSGTGHSPYDWDGDDDGNYGEYSVDGIDLSMEVYVGRLSATSTSAMSSLVNNILNYEKNPPSGAWYNRSVLAGAYSNYVTSSQVETDEAKLKEAIREDFLDDGNYVNYTLYEGGGIDPSSYPKNASLTTSNLISAINTGASIVNLAGHGSNTGIYRRIWSSDSNSNGYCDSGEYYDTSYYSTSASQTNGGKKPLFYNDACNNGNFDSAWCLTEDILRDVGIGAVGAGRVSWYSVGWSPGSDGGYYNQGHDYRFWEQYAGGAYRPGKALALSHSDYISDKTAHSKYAWKNLVQYNLMGDPEIPVYNSTPQQLNVTYSDPIPSPGMQTFTVKDPSGNAVKGAVVCLMNGTTFYSFATTDASGKATINIPTLTVMANLTVTCRNFDPLVTTVAIGVDEESPEFGMSLFSGNRTTGDYFQVGTMVTDNVMVTNVTVEYGWGSTAPAVTNNVSVNGTGSYWEFNSTHPNNSTDPFWFSFAARDRAGNWNHTAWTRINITDNDRPIFLGDNSSGIATTGDPFRVACSIDDNIAISACLVNYSMAGGPWTTAPLTGSGYDRSGTLFVPSDSLGKVEYLFNFTDLSGNSNQTASYQVNIIDDDAPVLVSDMTVLPPTTGNITTFSIKARDNIEISSAHLLFREAGGTEINYTMSGSDGENFTYDVMMPRDRVVEIVYQYILTDTSGNVFVSHLSNSTLTDDDLPELVSVSMDPFMTTGDVFQMNLEASDNIQVLGISVELVYPGELETSQDLSRNTSTGGWDLNMVQPESVTGNVTVTILVTDTAGNELRTSPFQLPLRDNDKPELIREMLSGDMESGETVTFGVEVDDNIGIREVTLVAPAMTDGPISMVRETRSFAYTCDMDIPRDLSGMVQYHFEVRDLSGNMFTTEDLNFTVEDMIVPQIEVQGFHVLGEGVPLSYLTTGESFTFLANITENIGLRDPCIEIDPGFGSPHMENLTLVDADGEFHMLSYHLEVPSNISDMITYRVCVSDIRGNPASTEWRQIDVVDNDPPVFHDHGCPSQVSTSSGPYRFYCNVSDNTAVSDISIHMKGHPEAIIEYDTTTTECGSLLIEGTFTMDSTLTEGWAELVVNISDGNGTSELISGFYVMDGTPPHLTIFGIPSTMDLSGSYSLEVEIRDNDQWTSPVAVWRSDSSDEVEIQLTKVEGTGVTADLTPPGPGNWSLHFEVSDESGNTASRVINVTVNDDVEPDVKMDIPDDAARVEDTIELDASSTEDDSGIAEYLWTVKAPDGTETTYSGPVLTLTPEMEGDFNVSLEVEDVYGNRALRSTTITVTPMPDDEDEGAVSDDMVLYAIIAGSVLLLLVVLAVILVAARKRKKEDEVDFEVGGEEKEEEEEIMSWD